MLVAGFRKGLPLVTGAQIGTPAPGCIWRSGPLGLSLRPFLILAVLARLMACRTDNIALQQTICCYANKRIESGIWHT